MLSIHYGTEGHVRTDKRQIREWRRHAAMRKDIDLIVGHHAHVVRGVEIVNGKIIFYGLGNFLHHGTPDISRRGPCRSQGLMAKVHLLKTSSGKLKARAIEAIPVTNTHFRPQRYTSVRASHQRVHALNYLARKLDNKKDGAQGVRFTPQADGSGLYCFPGAEPKSGKNRQTMQSVA